MEKTEKMPVSWSPVRHLVDYQPGELSRLLWSFGYFFLLLCGYFMLRPVREALAVAGGAEHIPKLFSATFVVMLLITPLFGWLVARFSRRVFLPVVYVFFIINLLLFYALFKAYPEQVWLFFTFFVWISVFNLFVVSVFWSFMADIFSASQGQRLFGFIAGGGSLGALIGPNLTRWLVPHIGTANLLLVASGIITIATLVILYLQRLSAQTTPIKDVAHSGEQTNSQPAASDGDEIGGSIWAGMLDVWRSPYLRMVVAMMVAHNLLAGFLYNLRGRIAEQQVQGIDQLTQFMAQIDANVNLIAIILQLVITPRLVKHLKMAKTLISVPVLLMVAFSIFSGMPILATVVLTQILQRSTNYGILGPTKEMLFTVVDRETKYKSKNFIDTAVYRGADVLAGWLFAGLMALGAGFSGVGLAALPIALLWMLLAWRLGSHYQRQADKVSGRQTV